MTLAIVLALVVSAAAAELAQATPQPAGVTSTTEVTLSDLQGWFNARTGSVRVVSLLSPTCPSCKGGHVALKNAFAQTDSAELKGFVVWLPMRAGDDVSAVSAQSAVLRDARVAEGWDPEREIGIAFARTLELRGTAWDVFLVYDRHVRWDGAAPPAPSFWMHQLRQDVGADQALCLNPTRFIREVLTRVRPSR